MVFVPGYKHDIFVSYARVDDQPMSETEQGWVTTMVKQLKILLGKRLGRVDAFSLWMDYQLAGNAPITPEIMETLHNTATLIMVLSPGYLASYWCQKEQNSFLSMIQERTHGGSSVFIVEIDRLDREERPPELRDLIGYQFWEADREGRPPRQLQLHPADHPAYDQRYYDRLNDLSYDLAKELQRLKQQHKEQPKQTHEEIPPPFELLATVFLADVTDDLYDTREELKRFLIRSNVRILPETYYPPEPDAFQEAVRNDLSQSKLFAQLLSRFLKKRPDLPQGDILRCQYNLTLEVGKPIVQWRSPDLDLDSVQDSEQREFLQGENVLAVGIEEFKSEIMKKLAPPQKLSLSSVQDMGSLVFVDADPHDNPLKDQICQVLEKFGIGYAFPLQSENPAENRQAFEQLVLDCDALLIVYGTVLPTWVSGQILSARKIVSKREEPLRAFAIYYGPPEEKPSIPLNFPGMHVLECCRNTGEEQLRKFIINALQSGTSV